jgi:hypothetical protein
MPRRFHPLVQRSSMSAPKRSFFAGQTPRFAQGTLQPRSSSSTNTVEPSRTAPSVRSATSSASSSSLPSVGRKTPTRWPRSSCAIKLVHPSRPAYALRVQVLDAFRDGNILAGVLTGG